MVKYKTCFFCNQDLDKKHDSKEHVIKNSIGGRKKVKGFICQECNNQTGNEWDNKIDESLGEYCSLLFKISRENGKVQTKKVRDNKSGKNYYFKSDGFSEIEPTHFIDEAIDKLIINAPSKNRAENYLKKLKFEYKNKGKELKTIGESNYEDIIERVEIETSFKFDIPSLDSNFSKSIVKSALALLSENSLALKSCILAKNFLQNKSIEPCLKYIYTFDPIINRPFATPLHCVYVFSKENKIDAYVELFGIARYYINLSDTYNGNKILFTYVMNPINGKELNISFNFFQDFKYEIHPRNIMKDLLDEVNFSNEIELIFNESIDYSWNKYKDIHEKFSHDLSNYFIKKALARANNRISYINFVTYRFEILINDFYKNIFKE